MVGQQKTDLNIFVPVSHRRENGILCSNIICISTGLVMTIINEHDFPPLPSREKKQRLAIERRAASQAPTSNSKRMWASLNDLPDELILEVLGYLPIDDNKFRSSTLPKLALTSRRLYQLVIGWLYERYDRCLGDPYLFLRTLVSNPRKAELVRDVHIYTTPQDLVDPEYWSPPVPYDIEQYVPTAKDKKIIKEGLRAINVPSWKTRASQCNDEDLDDDQVLQNTLLLFTPNVKSISHTEGEIANLPTPKPEWVDIISRAAAGAFGGVHHFEHLRSIEGVAEYDLTTGTGGFDTDKHIRELRRLIPPACNNVEELILDRCVYSEQCLDLIVKSSRRLKTFKYHVDMLPEWGDWDNEWRWNNLPMDRSKTMTEILRAHEASLETFHINGDYRLASVLLNRVHLYDDMTAFTSLKEISCPLGIIVAEGDVEFADRLPRSLVKFRTPVRPFTYDRRLLGALKHMLVNCKTYTPQLSEVRVVQTARVSADWKDFLKLSSETGVKFVEEEGSVEPTVYPDIEDSDVPSEY
ncbi:hypothetical protein yc1106_03637 [Curvularia clavata]|uniref:F-box domain-containing protein n=1 Tax=Curvularia clavata TaxID=95742 RepID=A0A9Q8Z8S2_CURCL|nr:hypothetical protein yc1106_03637 [Curvularia clavata]